MFLSRLVLITTLIITFSCVEAQNNGDIRLVGSNETLPYQGRLEIFLNKKWGTICGKNSPNLRGVADTACRQLRFKYAFAYGTVDEFSYPVAPTGTPIHIESIDCPFSDSICSEDYLLHVLRCKVDQRVDPSICTHDDDVAVYCYPESILSPSYESQIALYAIAPYEPPVNVSLSSGVVGIFFHRSAKPGLICGTGLDQNVADTACCQLGYTNALSFNASGHTTKLTVWDSGLNCKSQSRSCLNSCFSKEPTNQTFCSSVVAVSCEFQLTLKNDNRPGSPLQCDMADSCNAHPTSSPGSFTNVFGIIIFVVVFVIVALTVAFITTLLLCFLKPGCVIYNKRNQYKPII